MYVCCVARERRLCLHTRISVAHGWDRLKQADQGELTKGVRGFEDVRTAEWTSLVMIGRSYTLASAQSS